MKAALDSRATGCMGRRQSGREASASACSRSSRPLRRSPMAKRGQEDGTRRTASSYSSALMACSWSLAFKSHAVMRMDIVQMITDMVTDLKEMSRRVEASGRSARHQHGRS